MRKSISLILAIVMIAMVFATIPFTAFAADETTTPTAPADAAVEVTVEGEAPVYVALADVAAKFKLVESDENVTWTAAKTGKPFTVKLLKDIAVIDSFWIFPGENTVFDGNGCTLTAAPAEDWVGQDNRIFGIRGYVVENDEITIKNLIIDNSEAAGGRSCNIMQPYSCPTINMGEGNYWVAREKGVWFTNTDTTFNITGGYYEAGDEAFYTHTDDKAGTLNISGGTFKTRKADGNAVNARKLALNITGGTFFGNIASIGATTLTAGALVGKTIVPEGTTIPETFKVYESAAATIGDTIYVTLAEAITAANAATEDVTITLLSDVEAVLPTSANGKAHGYALNNTNGKTITLDGQDQFAISFSGGNNSLYPNGNVVIQNITLNQACSGSTIQSEAVDGSVVTLKNVDINVTANSSYTVINTLNASGTTMTLNIEDTNVVIAHDKDANTGNTAGIIRTGNGGNNVTINIKNSVFDATGSAKRNGIVFTTAATVVIDNTEFKLAEGGYSITRTGSNQPKSVAIDDKSVVPNIDETVQNITKAGEAIAVILGTDGAVKATLTDVANLQAFFDQVADGDTIKLYQNIEVAKPYTVRGTFTFDGNGKTITYTEASNANSDIFYFKNTEAEYDANNVEVPADKMDTATVVNLKIVSTQGGGGLRTYNSNLVLGEGNDFDFTSGTRNAVWDCRQLGTITINGGNYKAAGYVVSVDGGNSNLVITGGTFTGNNAGAINLAGGTHTISGGTFKSVGDKDGVKLISAKGGELNITGGTFVQENVLGYVLALRAAATTVTVNGASVDMSGRVLFESNDNVLNLTAGKLDGSFVSGKDKDNNILVEDLTKVVVKAEGFNHIDTSALPEVYYQEEGGELIGLSFSSALTEAGMAMFDVTITLNKNVVLESGVGIGSPGITVTIKGNGNTITAADGIGNVFQITGNGTNLAIENAKLTGNPVGANKDKSSCFFQIKGDDAGVSLKDVTAYDIEVMYHFINAMGNNGSAKYVTFDNVTTKNITGTNASISALIQTGNRQKTTPGGDHTNYSVVVVKNSNLEHWRRIIECSEGSAYNVLVENSTLTILEPGDQSAVRIYPVCNLLPAEDMPQSGRVVLRDVTYNVPEGGHTVKYEPANNLVVIEETPEDVVAQIVVEDGTVIDIKRNEFADKFSKADTTKNITTSEQLKGKAWTLNILADLVFTNPTGKGADDVQLAFYLNSDKEIVINGDPNGLGINAKITSTKQVDNPLFRLYDNGSSGKITFKNLDRDTTSTMMQIYTNMAEVNFENCVWTSTTRGITIYGGSDTTANFKAGSVFTSTGGSILFTNWGWTAGMITVEEGATISCADLVNKANANYGNIKLKVNGGTVIGNITADAGMYMLLAGKLEGDIIIPETEDGLKLFLDEYICSPDFVVTGTNDFAEEEEEETTTNQGGEGTTAPGGEGTTAPGGEGTTAPGGDNTTVPGGDVTTVPGGDVTTVPGGDVTTVPGGETTTAPAGDKPAEGCAGCGGFSIAATFLALICAAGAALVIKKK